jgi:hypothetical protein
MRRRVGVAALVVAGALVVPVVPAAANTTVKVDGNNVTITVHVDCVGCKDWPAPDGGDLATFWEQTTETAWNKAFDKFSYCNKYKFKLNVDIKNRPADYGSTPGRHRILAGAPSGDALAGTGWNGAPEHTPGGDPGQRSPDGTRYYENDGDGIMPADATQTVIEHEFGHVIGLGDDRDDAGNAVGQDTKGIMVGGAKGITPNTKLAIGKNHVDRIGKQLENLGKLACGVAWNGPIEGHVTAPGCSPAEIPVHGKLDVSVREHGDVSGQGGWTEDGFSCGGQEVAPTTLTFAVTGHKSRDAFMLQLEGQALQMPARGGHARGTVDIPGSGGYGSTLTFTLDREEKKEAVG